MTSSFTGNKDIEKPANGDYPNTWNVPVNADWDIIDRAFGSSVGKSLSNLDINLTRPEAQNQQIVLTGTLTGNVQIFVPLKRLSASEAVGGSWVVYNNTTGSFTVTMYTEAPGGSGIILPQGRRSFVYSDGTNMAFADDVRLASGNAAITVSGSTITLGIPVSVANDGTGASTLTANNVLVGNGTSAVGFIAPGTSGNVLTSTGTTWTSQAPTGGGGTGTVTSVGFSTGTIGLTVSGSNPITTSGTFTLAGVLNAANGGTGVAGTLTGYLKANGTGAMTASATVLGSDVSGNILGSAANVTGVVALANGGTGATSAAAAATALGVGTTSAASFSSVTTTGRGTFNSVRVSASAAFDAIGFAGGICNFNVTASSSIFGTASGMEHYAAGAPNFATSSTYFRVQSGITPQAFGTTAWTNVSDSRIKKNVSDYGHGLAELKQIRTVTYQFNGQYGTVNDGKINVGLIAQEVQNTPFAQMVDTWQYSDKETGAVTDLLSVNTTPLVFALINAVKELSAEVESLKAKLP